eukprot:1692761-Rhodomonas_salina.3
MEAREPTRDRPYRCPIVLRVPYGMPGTVPLCTAPGTDLKRTVVPGGAGGKRGLCLFRVPTVLAEGAAPGRVRADLLATLQQVYCAICHAMDLRACYAKSGTHLAYDATCLRASYAIPGTDIAYAATRYLRSRKPRYICATRCAVLTERMVLPASGLPPTPPHRYTPTRVLHYV